MPVKYIYEPFHGDVVASRRRRCSVVLVLSLVAAVLQWDDFDIVYLTRTYNFNANQSSSYTRPNRVHTLSARIANSDATERRRKRKDNIERGVS